MTEKFDFNADEFTIEVPVLDAVKHPALRGVTLDKGAGVIGVNHANASLGLLGGRDRVFRQNVGVYGESNQQGVFGHSTSETGTGVYGNSAGTGFGVRGDSTEGVAVQGQSFGNGLAGKFIGNVEVTGSLVVQGVNLDALLTQHQALASLIGRIQALEQTNQQLQQQVTALTSRVTTLERQSNAGGGGTGTPSITVSSAGSGGQNLTNFRIAGSGFGRNEAVTINITSRSKFGQPTSSPTSTTADASGNIAINRSLFCDNGMEHDITAVGANGKSSNTVKTNC